MDGLDVWLCVSLVALVTSAFVGPGIYLCKKYKVCTCNCNCKINKTPSVKDEDYYLDEYLPAIL